MAKKFIFLHSTFVVLVVSGLLLLAQIYKVKSKTYVLLFRLDHFANKKEEEEEITLWYTETLPLPSYINNPR